MRRWDGRVRQENGSAKHSNNQTNKDDGKRDKRTKIERITRQGKTTKHEIRNTCMAGLNMNMAVQRSETNRDRAYDESGKDKETRAAQRQ